MKKIDIKKAKKKITKALIIVIVCCFGFLYLKYKTDVVTDFLIFYYRLTRSNPENREGPYKVLYVLDGDTICVEIKNEKVKVRLIGIDTPESVAPDQYLQGSDKENSEDGKLASQHTEKLIRDHDSVVYLEYDIEKNDKYGRVLAYVWFSDGVMLNSRILQDGYGLIMTYKPNVKYLDIFTQNYNQAVENKQGLWKEKLPFLQN